MVDRVTKALRRLSGKERKAVALILRKLQTGAVKTLDSKRLKGNSSVYRVRKGSLRILYQAKRGEHIKILAIERRSDTTYKKF